MKVYYFMIIAIGVMYLLSLAGVDTGSSQIFNKIGMIGNNTANQDIIPDSSADEATDIKNSSSFWVAISATFIVLAIASGIRVSAGFVTWQSSVEAILAGFAGFIFSMFALDFYSILKKMYTITGGTGWEFHLTWILVVPFLVGFGLAVIEMIRGND